MSVEERGREAGRLRRQASTLGIDSCPMELVATYSFVELYGREGIGDVVQYLVSVCVCDLSWSCDQDYEPCVFMYIRTLLCRSN